MPSPEPDPWAATVISREEKLLFLKELSALCRKHNIYVEGPSPEEDPAIVRPRLPLADDQTAYWYSAKSGLHYVEGCTVEEDDDIEQDDITV